MTTPQAYPHAPGAKGQAETGYQAADAIEAQVAALSLQALKAIDAAGQRGVTADEAAAYAGVSILAMRPRLSELKAKNLVRDSGIRRRNDSGRLAVVWERVA